MGEILADITLKNVLDVGDAHRGHIKAEEVREITVKAVVDTGASTICITEDVFSKLGLRIINQSTATVADGRSVECSKTSPVDIHWEDRSCSIRATLIPGSKEILLGVIPLEDMDLIVDPQNQKLIGAHGDKPVFRI